MTTSPDERFERARPRLTALATRMLGSTAAVLGDWDLPSTLLRRTLQSGARALPVASDQEPLLAHNPGDLELFDRSLIAKSRGPRTDLASRYVLPPSL